MLNQTDWERLQAIHHEMSCLLEEADNLVRWSGQQVEYLRAKHYWINGMSNYLHCKELAGCSMEETIQALEPAKEDEEEFEEDEDGTEG